VQGAVNAPPIALDQLPLKKTGSGFGVRYSIESASTHGVTYPTVLGWIHAFKNTGTAPGAPVLVPAAPAVPAAPTGVKLVADCQSMDPADHQGCWITDFWQGSTLSLKLSWSEASALQGFCIYETPFGGPGCVMDVIGPTTLRATVGSGARSWVGTLRWTNIDPNKQHGVRYSISAFNAAGGSKPTTAQARWSVQTWWEEPLDWGGACSGVTP
jgi:hypothetical protein